MKKAIGGLFGLMVCVAVHAGTQVDVYGLNPQSSSRIIKQYGKAVATIESLLQDELKKMHQEDEYGASVKRLLAEKQALIKKIKRDYGFLFVEFQTVFYPGEADTYTTIEVVDKQHAERMRFVNALPYTAPKREKIYRPDLIDAMLRYQGIVTDLMRHNQLGPLQTACPVYHCFAGFEMPVLKPFLAVFNNGVIKDRQLILKTVRDDPDPERRAGAVFLVGHFRDPHEILSLLSPLVRDRDPAVRNNVMRVIALTMETAKISDIDPMPFIEALDSPYTTDRNKALFVLYAATASEKARLIILHQGGMRLLDLMQLKQPNNHDSAFVILKKLSGQSFTTNDTTAWRSWVQSALRS